jgi:protein tyrosine phosphatase
MYKDSLNLTDVQVDSVKAILKDIQPLQREIAMNQEMSRQDKALALKEVNEQRNARLKAVLTKEQFEKLKDMEQRRREQMRERAAERFDGNRGGF